MSAAQNGSEEAQKVETTRGSSSNETAGQSIQAQATCVAKGKSTDKQTAKGPKQRVASKSVLETPAETTEVVPGSGDLGCSFSSRLRDLRRAKALSLRKLGRSVGVTANAVLRWEKDEVTPTRGKMIELSQFFDVEPAWLAWGIGARRNRLKPIDLITQLEQCDEPQLRAISALLESFESRVED